MNIASKRFKWGGQCVVVALLLSISACGFHLRGTNALPTEYAEVFIEADRRSYFVKSLERSLNQRGVSLVSSKGSATSLILIHSDTDGQRILSVTATEGPEEYEVFHVVNFSLLVKEERQIDAQEITLTRDYTYDKNDVLGKSHEYQSLRDALAEEMAETLIRRLQYAF